LDFLGKSFQISRRGGGWVRTLQKTAEAVVVVATVAAALGGGDDAALSAPAV